MILTPVSVGGWLEALECALGVEESAVVEPEVFTAAVLGADFLSALLDWATLWKQTRVKNTTKVKHSTTALTPATQGGLLLTP